MAQNYNIYVIEYYEEDPRFHWTNTLHDRVLATSQQDAENKFRQKHPDIRVFTITNIHYSDY